MARTDSAGTSKDRAQLSIQIDHCADLLPSLMVETRRQANEAVKRGDLNGADKLDDISAELSMMFQIVLRHQIQQIDDSQEMRDSIVAMTKINKGIEDIIAGTKQAAAFLKAATGVVNGLTKIAEKILK